MKKLPRYVLLEVIKTFIFALFGFTVLMLLMGIVQQAIEHGLPLTQILLLIPYLIPESLLFAIPVTLLLAVTSVYSRMASYNEIVAVKSLGISPWTIIWPVLTVGLLLSFFTVWLNDVAVSWGRTGIKRVVLESFEDIAYGMLRTKRVFASPKFTITVRDVQGQCLIDFSCSIRDQEIEITAREAYLDYNPATNKLDIRLIDGTFDSPKMSYSFPDEETHSFSLAELSPGRSQQIQRPADTPLRKIGGRIDREERQLATNEREMAVRTAFALSFGNFEELKSTQWNQYHHRQRELNTVLSKLRTEPARRWSAGFSCICFMWIGIPMAIWVNSRDFLTSFFMCFMPILLIYYPLLMFGLDGAKNGMLPAYSVWAGNSVLLLVGMFVMRKVVRY